MKHTCRFNKISSKIEKVSRKVAMEQMFGKLPPLPTGKKWDKVSQMVTIFKCRCGKTQTFIDEESGDWNKTLPDSFVLPIHK